MQSSICHADDALDRDYRDKTKLIIHLSLATTSVNLVAELQNVKIIQEKHDTKNQDFYTELILQK
jgi:hypothetical protein